MKNKKVAIYAMLVLLAIIIPAATWYLAPLKAHSIYGKSCVISMGEMTYSPEIQVINSRFISTYDDQGGGVYYVNGRIIFRGKTYHLSRSFFMNHEPMDKNGFYKYHFKQDAVLGTDNAPDEAVNALLKDFELVKITRLNDKAWLFSSPASPMYICVLE